MLKQPLFAGASVSETNSFVVCYAPLFDRLKGGLDSKEHHG
jgi:hypothetical protein